MSGGIVHEPWRANAVVMASAKRTGSLGFSIGVSRVGKARPLKHSLFLPPSISSSTWSTARDDSLEWVPHASKGLQLEAADVEGMIGCGGSYNGCSLGMAWAVLGHS